MEKSLPHPTPRGARPRAGSLLALALAAAACSPGADAPDAGGAVAAAPATGSPRPGVVLSVDGLELRAEEVEPLAGAIAELYPEYSRDHVRRLALTNEWLTRLALHAADPAGWAAARAACTAADPATLEPQLARGGFLGLGLGLWSVARQLPPGQWSGPIELTGRWVRIRLDERQEHPDPRQEELAIALLDFPFVPPEEARERMDAAVDAARLAIVDPAWDEIVPEHWKHRMRGPSR